MHYSEEKSDTNLYNPHVVVLVECQANRFRLEGFACIEIRDLCTYHDDVSKSNHHVVRESEYEYNQIYPIQNKCLHR